MELFQSVEDPDRTGPIWHSFSIGELLGLPQSAVDEIKSSYQSAVRRKEAYLDTYANQHLWPSWKKVVDVLQECGLYQQSDDVKNTYVQGIILHMLCMASEEVASQCFFQDFDEGGQKYLNSNFGGTRNRGVKRPVTHKVDHMLGGSGGMVPQKTLRFYYP